MNTVTLRDWAAEENPSYKGESIGFDTLTNAELLSIIISGAKDTAQEVFHLCGNNLKELAHLRSDQIGSVKGMGKQKVARIQAFIELANRMNSEHIKDKTDLSTATRAYNHFYWRLAQLDHEEFWVAYLNTNMRLIKSECIGKGGITEVTVDVRVILRHALIYNAPIIICAHNHPSGSTSPSKIDDKLTFAVHTACNSLLIKMADHIIITDGNYYSYHENGKL